MSESAPSSATRAALALAAILPAPTLGIVAALYVWPDTALGQIAYAVADK
jgi:hypothetical protein